MWSSVQKFGNIDWEALVVGCVRWLAMLVKESGSQIIAEHPNIVAMMVLTCLSSSFITVMIPSSSVAVVFVPSSQGAFQFSIECGE